MIRMRANAAKIVNKVIRIALSWWADRAPVASSPVVSHADDNLGGLLFFSE